MKQISDTDVKMLIRLLSQSAVMIEGMAVKPKDMDLARRCRRMMMKLKMRCQCKQL
jgi:hypothetical protein